MCLEPRHWTDARLKQAVLGSHPPGKYAYYKRSKRDRGMALLRSGSEAHVSGASTPTCEPSDRCDRGDSVSEPIRRALSPSHGIRIRWRDWGDRIARSTTPARLSDPGRNRHVSRLPDHLVPGIRYTAFALTGVIPPPFGGDGAIRVRTSAMGKDTLLAKSL